MKTTIKRTCCFTGHREIPPGDKKRIQRLLEEKIRVAIDRKMAYFGVGGAIGFDTMAAKTILKLKKEFPYIKLILVLPCKEQSERWKIKDRVVYQYLISHADKIVYTADHYFNGCMQVRNRHLVDHSSMCICYLTKENGGTAYTVKYAQKKQLEIIPIS